MIDSALASAVKKLNEKTKLVDLKYLDSNYKPSNEKDFSIAFLTFANGEKFEIGVETFEYFFEGYRFKK
jgi:uncharacterized protein YkvS